MLAVEEGVVGGTEQFFFFCQEEVTSLLKKAVQTEAMQCEQHRASRAEDGRNRSVSLRFEGVYRD